MADNELSEMDEVRVLTREIAVELKAWTQRNNKRETDIRKLYKKIHNREKGDLNPSILKTWGWCFGFKDDCYGYWGLRQTGKNIKNRHIAYIHDTLVALGIRSEFPSFSEGPATWFDFLRFALTAIREDLNAEAAPPKQPDSTIPPHVFDDIVNEIFGIARDRLKGIPEEELRPIIERMGGGSISREEIPVFIEKFVTEVQRERQEYTQAEVQREINQAWRHLNLGSFAQTYEAWVSLNEEQKADLEKRLDSQEIQRLREIEKAEAEGHTFQPTTNIISQAPWVIIQENMRYELAMIKKYDPNIDPIGWAKWNLEYYSSLINMALYFNDIEYLRKAEKLRQEIDEFSMKYEPSTEWVEIFHRLNFYYVDFANITGMQKRKGLCLFFLKLSLESYGFLLRKLAVIEMMIQVKRKNVDNPINIEEKIAAIRAYAADLERERGIVAAKLAECNAQGA